MKVIKPIIIAFLHLAVLTNSLALVHAQTRQRGAKKSQSQVLPKADGPQKRDDDEVLRVTTNLVAIPVSVRANDGTYLFDLRKE